jgi:hypothetical protein
MYVVLKRPTFQVYTPPIIKDIEANMLEEC